MPLQLGMASSHAPALFYSTFDGWERGFQRLDGHRPKPPETAIETREEMEQRRIPRFRDNFAALKQQLADFKPDVLIVVGGDQGEWFDAANFPQVMVYAGESMWGVHNTGSQDQDPPEVPAEHYDKYRLDFTIDQELARKLQEGLMAEGIDAALSTKMNPQGRAVTTGSPHAFMFPMPHLLPRLDLPIVPIFIVTTENTAAIMTGERCLALGRAIAKVCEGSDKRIAIYGSGGMSHDPGGPRSGWVDEPLDHWFLDQLTLGTPETLKAMFSFHSENFYGGTGELRTWITVAAAMDQVKSGHQAKVVDYLPTRKGSTGMGWVYWPQVEAKQPVAAR